MSLCHPTVLQIKVVSAIPINQADNNIALDLTLYQRLVGKFIYLACDTRSNITFVVG